MEEIKEFFKDVKRIADGIEAIAKTKEGGVKMTSVETVCNCLNVQCEQHKQEQQAVPQQVQIPAQQIPVQAPVQQPVQMPVQQPVQQMPAQTAIPVSNVTQPYTQEQLAVAMGRAVDAGKMQQIQAILGAFNVSSLMELKQEQYNDLALKLKEIGVDV